MRRGRRTRQRRKMLEENQQAKEVQRIRKQEARIEDERLQQAYVKMLGKIESDRLKELQAREDRIQKFMNNMAHNVLAEQDQAKARRI